eukprot:CAMPEP_0184858342 /NCGR_PEP_ID=MMETSP0580-20130426/3463_1 /TAXON_ID=1118495 /ORGANISM="Dactyliosolen fragilissimus" /LENGTH=826 /DNA_ID=CAMNT_0027354451 /DNA_START=320 /DNA_END=2800 /DNA_ORIENTATION=-
MSEEENHVEEQDEGDQNDSSNIPIVDDYVDENTLRIMVSTDNHLGYAEKDAVRGLDSFAAFEEVLMLAKRHKCDMVLLAGDLFHDNKPSRRTLYKTIEIMRRYCMGPNPVQFQIVSDQSKNFRSLNGTVNYEDQYYSVDLPIFSIHGNHDDPTREGGSEMLAPLDLLAVNNLVNYFGRQDEVDKVEISPILIQKGTTRVALYGMGNMRDERLNRMWTGKKVRFLRPENGEESMSNQNNESDSDEDKDEEWFNIFALHQNRDLGRGSKNCVHESMIPEWMDLIVWGHEHECQILPTESAVGTYRITQPGSSVATSLTLGESLRKQVGILDVRDSQFRLLPIPLSQVRAFTAGEVCLNDIASLDPEDPKCEDRTTDVLAREVERLIEEGRETSKLLLKDARAAALGVVPDDEEGNDDHAESIVAKGLKFKVHKPDQVLVRLKVEHSGFTTLNNQRFGSRFVHDVANPTDILLFHRKRTTEKTKSGKQKNSSSSAGLNNEPIAPQDLSEVNVEDLVHDVLDSSEKKLNIVNQSKLGEALDEFVAKEHNKAFMDTVSKIVHFQQKKLLERGVETDKEPKPDDEMSNNDDEEIEGRNEAEDVCMGESAKVNKRQSKRSMIGHSGNSDNFSSEEAPRKRGGNKKRVSEKLENDSDSGVTPTTNRNSARKNFALSSSQQRLSYSIGASNRKSARSREKPKLTENDTDLDNDNDGVIDLSQPSTTRLNSRPRRAATKTNRYKLDDDSHESEISEEDIIENSAPTTNNRGQVNDITPVHNRRADSRRGAKSRTRRMTSYDSSSDEEVRERKRSQASDGWGIASQSSQPKRRRKWK